MTLGAKRGPIRSLAKDLVATLTPHFELLDVRREWLRPLLLDRADLAGELAWEGAPRVFTARLVSLCLSQAHPEAGSALLDDLLAALAEEGVGLDPARQAAFTDLRARLAALDPDDLPADPATRRRRTIALAGAAFTAGLAALALGVPYWRSCRAPIDGALRVAVASFGRGTADGSSRRALDGHRLAKQVAAHLDQELRQLLATRGGTDAVPHAIAVRGPSLLCPVVGLDADARARSAARLSKRIDADILVYGTHVVTDTGDGIVASRLVPAFHVTDDPRRLRDAGEFAGSHALGTPIEDPDTITGGGALGEAIRVRTGLLASFVVALSYFADRQYERAEGLLAQVASDSGWPEHEGKEVVYLFLGNVVLQDLGRDRPDRITQAGRWFDDALALDPEYARAQLGAAEVAFQRARGDANCRAETVDVDELENAITRFGAAKEAAHQPPESDVAVKADFSAGRAAVCLAVAAGDQDWSATIEPFENVIAAYDEGDGLRRKQLRDWAAESAGMLGVIGGIESRTAAANADAEAASAASAAALAHFERAIEIGDRHARDAVFHVQRADLLLATCDLAAAVRALRDAERAEGRAVAEEEAIGPSYIAHRDRVRADVDAGTLGPGCAADETLDVNL